MRFLVALAKCPLIRVPDREQEALAGRAQRIRLIVGPVQPISKVAFWRMGNKTKKNDAIEKWREL